ncbi:restriction endonuclease subunit S [Enterobacter asburiae]|uniref:Restriction endonuclease subunit S n=1 Tax=Enterobacter asburiae TaxID=61645 RepID=A0A7W3HFV5_ENTAS|nr:restriction endonuclease subunit S [Enterobacter asburiae]MBA8079476.1 restriction endonuclease subunit S [Enterobacter asburiae]
MTVEKLITDHIDIWSSALQTRSTAGRGSNGKVDLYGIKKLRELILELAVRGKLVPQDPNDEPAYELLKRIAAEKAELVKQGKIKKQKPLPEISEDEKPFELPEGWEWVRFGDISEIERGGSPRPIKDYLTTDEAGLNWIKIGDTDIGGKYISSTDEKIKPSGLHKTRMVYPGDFLLTNSMSFGRPYITLIEGCIHDGWLRISPLSLLDKDFLYLLLSSPFIIKAFKEKASGAVVLNLNADKVRETFILIPPFAEQQRIVAKVNELMSLCDQLEQQSLTSLNAHQQLVVTLLATLTDSQNAEELAENWERISLHFDTLFTTEASIDALKQTILQLAVMGKLVPQDPNDEPASELLKHIEQEKAQLVKEGKIKKQKPLPPVSDEEKPFALPVGWEWCRFEDVVDIQSGITKGRNLAGRTLISVPYLRVANVQRGYLQLSDIKSIEIPVEEKDKYHVQKGDLLITEGGDWDTVGRTAVWTDATFYVANQNHVFKARPLVNELNVKWLETFMNSSVSRDYFAGASKQTTNLASINKTQLRGCFIALPPISETSRILDQYISLLNVCDTLKSRLLSAQQTQLHLADALTDAALS